MANPRFPDKSEEKFINSIKSKIKPCTLELIEQLIENNENILKLYTREFRFADSAVNLMNSVSSQELRKHYFPESYQTPIEIFLSAFGQAEFAQEFLTNPKVLLNLKRDFKKPSKQNLPTESEINDLAVKIWASSRCHFLNLISILKYKRSIYELLNEGKTDDKALTNAISIDKLLLNYPLSQDRIKKATLQNDQKFFSLLSTALRRKIKVSWNIDTLRLALFAYTLLIFELDHLTYEEILELTERYNIYPASSAESLSKQLNRVGFAKFNKTKRINKTTSI